MKAPSSRLLRALRYTLATQQAQTAPNSLHVLQGFRGRAISSGVSKCRFSNLAGSLHASSPKSTDRGPPSKEDTQTDFGSLDVLGNMQVPTTAIDACLTNGFHFNNGLKISDGSGCLLIAGEAFSWRPWELSREGRNGMINSKGQWAVDGDAWGVLNLVWPKPDMVILGLGASVYPISPETRRKLNSMGVRVEIQDTRNAAAQFNLLATERGVSSIAAALIPIGWQARRP